MCKSKTKLSYRPGSEVSEPGRSIIVAGRSEGSFAGGFHSRSIMMYFKAIPVFLLRFYMVKPPVSLPLMAKLKREPICTAAK